MKESEPAKLTEAQKLTDELRTAFDGLHAAISSYEQVEAGVRRFLDENELVPPPEEGLEEDFNDLFQFWRRTPDAAELKTAARLRLV